MEKELCMTRLDLSEESIQSVWNFCIKFDTWKEHWKLSVLEVKPRYYKCEIFLRENYVYR